MKKEAKKTLISFGLASGLNDLGADMIKPFWPAFVTGVLGAPVAFLGLLDGLGDAIAYGVRFPAGLIADKIRKYKIFIWLGYLFAGLSKIGYALSKIAFLLLPFKILDRLGKARDPPRDALLAKVIPKDQRGYAFGFLTAADNLGATLAPLLALVLFPLLGYRKLFAFAAIPSLIGAALLILLIKERKAKDFLPLKFEFNKKFVLLTLVSIVFGISWFSISFLILFANQTIPIRLNPILLFLTSAAAVAGSWSSGMISDRIGRKLVYAFGFIIWSAICFFAAILKELNIFTALIFFLAYGIQFGIITTIQSPFIADIVEENQRATSLGFLQTLFGFSLLIASLIAGLLWDFLSPIATFYFGFIFSLLAIALIFIFKI